MNNQKNDFGSPEEKLIRGFRNNQGRGIVCISNLDGTDDKILPHIERHSPDGFNWGYGGSGPADLALSILTAVLGPEIADRWYFEFKWDFVACLNPMQGFEITTEQINNWYNMRPIEGAKS